MEFMMRPQKPGRLPYLLLTVGSWIAFTMVLTSLTKLLPAGPLLSILPLLLSVIFVSIVAYFLIFQKNHQIQISGDSLRETTWTAKEGASFSAEQIHSVRRNVLKEVILLDEGGNKLLTVEAYMTNFDQFENWLKKHNKI